MEHLCEVRRPILTSYSSLYLSIVKVYYIATILKLQNFSDYPSAHWKKTKKNLSCGDVITYCSLLLKSVTEVRDMCTSNRGGVYSMAQSSQLPKILLECPEFYETNALNSLKCCYHQQYKW